ncbi:MAG: SUMF1/EgtB/PvdO family nonheme iron enzyme [Polyangiaceae bacterium]
MAPEQFRGGPVTSATDVWTFALVAYFVLTGTPYWRSSSNGHLPFEQLLAEMEHEPLVPASVRAQEQSRGSLVPQGFDAWFASCVVRDSRRRIQTVTDAARGLVALLDAAIDDARIKEALSHYHFGPNQYHPPTTRTSPPSAAYRLLAFPIIGAVLALGFLLVSVRERVGPYGDPLGFFLLGTALATASPLLVSRTKGPVVRWAFIALVGLAVAMSGAFVGCTPPTKRSAPTIGGNDPFSMGFGAVVGAMVGVGLVSGAQAASGVDEFTTKPLRGLRAILFGAGSFLALGGFLWCLNRAAGAYGPWKAARRAAWLKVAPKDWAHPGQILAANHAAQLERFTQARKGIAIPIPGGMVRLRFAWQSEKVAPFQLDDVEVTIGAYADCYVAKRCSTLANYKLSDILKLSPEALSFPIFVPRAQAVEYCRAVNRRLPTRTEWLLAAFGPADVRRFPWGASLPTEKICRHGEFNDKSPIGCSVGTSPGDRTPEGVWDLGYNGREWVAEGMTLGQDYSASEIASTALRDEFYPQTAAFRCASQR